MLVAGDCQGRHRIEPTAQQNYRFFFYHNVNYIYSEDDDSFINQIVNSKRLILPAISNIVKIRKSRTHRPLNRTILNFLTSLQLIIACFSVNIPIILI
jgi:hypothetical protein